MAQGLVAPPPPMAARHGRAQNRAAHGDSDPPPSIPTSPDPTRNSPLETTTMECQSHTIGPNAFLFLSRAQKSFQNIRQMAQSDMEIHARKSNPMIHANFLKKFLRPTTCILLHPSPLKSS